MTDISALARMQPLVSNDTTKAWYDLLKLIDRGNLSGVKSIIREARLIGEKCF